MNVTCPECRSIFRVDPGKVPSSGVRARCSECGGVIAIGAPEGRATPAGGRTVAPPAATRPAATVRPAPVPPTRPAPAAAPQGTPRLGSAPASTSRSGASTSGPPSPFAGQRLAPAPSAARAPAGPPGPRVVGASQTTAGGAAASPPAPRIVPPMPAPAPAPVPAQQPGASGQPAGATAGTATADASQGARSSESASGSGAPPAGARGAELGSGRRSINPFLTNDPNLKARRLARALVSDMVTYLPQKRDEGLRNGTLKSLFREEIKKSYEEYVEQVGREVAESTPHFQEALNEILAGGTKVF